MNLKYKWIFKAIVQKTISYLPYPQKLNLFFQKYVTKGIELSDDYFGMKLQHAVDHYHYLRKYHSMNQPLTILELGTGWYPIVPIVFFLTGCGEVTSIDIQNWITRDNQIRTIRKFLEWRLVNKSPPPTP
jgi:hypothetical protein